ncbi:MAG: aspartate-semialdehyde dehydrogenase [Calditrichaeota bacterium]|nr:MAG: aspartate-semialdehyde dehydrogenase [Calditrichota bacterium]
MRVAVVGCTGLVGETMLRVLEERRFPVEELVPVASHRSAGRQVTFAGRSWPVQPLSESVFAGVQLALFSAGAAVSREFAPLAVRQGAFVVDNSSAWRMEPDVPLVVPEVNAGALDTLKEPAIIANPNCSTIQLVVALNPLHRVFGLKRVVVATYQAVTGSGREAVQQLKDELSLGRAPHPVYPHPIAMNCLPHIDQFLENGYTREEMKIIQESRKILGEPELAITATAVRVPVLGGHSEAVNVQLVKPFDLNQVYRLLEEAPGVQVVDEPTKNRYPMPITAAKRDEVFVGRLRRDPSAENALNLWIVSDNLRKGAATNAVQIAEYLLQRGVLNR